MLGMLRAFPLACAELPAIWLEGELALIDTGATVSMHAPARRVPDGRAAGMSPLARAMLGHERRGVLWGMLEQLASMAWPGIVRATRSLGLPGELDLLVGVDRLSGVDLMVAQPHGFIAMGVPAAAPGALAAGPCVGPRLASELRFGLPTVHARWGEKRLRLVLDTGAQMGYLVDRPPHAPEPGGPHVDHHPLAGSFESPVWSLDLALEAAGKADGEVLLRSARFGVLQGTLAAELRLAGCDGVIGAEVFSRGAVLLRHGLQHVTLCSGGLHLQMGPHYDGMFDDIYGHVMRADAAQLARMASAQSVERVLDLGAGGGRVSEALAGCGMHVVAVEPGLSLVGSLVRRPGVASGRVEAWVGSAEELDLPGPSVDLVLLAFGVVDYITDDDACIRGLQRALAHTRPGGECWIQPAGRSHMQSMRAAGARYARQVEVSDAQDGLVEVWDRIDLLGQRVVDERVTLRYRSMDQLAGLAARAGWQVASAAHAVPGLVYPLLRVRAPAVPGAGAR